MEQPVIASEHQSLLLLRGHTNSKSANSETVTYDSVEQIQQDVASTHPEQGDNDEIIHNNNNKLNDVFNATMPLWTLVCILSTAFSYGCILTTLFLITLPTECNRIHAASHDIPKSVALGQFVAIAGITQLVSPIVGRVSDSYRPAASLQVGQRLPYLVTGAICTVTGLLGQMLSSWAGFWIRYGLAFFLHMIGLNIMYAMMLALLADQVPACQIGMANGVLALLLVTGSLFGFGLFHSTILGQEIQNMYGLYTCIVIVSAILTGTHAQDMDVALAVARQARRRQQPSSLLSSSSSLNDLEASKLSKGATATTITTTDAAAATTSPRRSTSLSSLTTTATSSKTISPVHTKWHRRARKAVVGARKAAVRAHQTIVVTPTVLLQTMIQPLQQMTCRTLAASYNIDMTKHHDFFVVTVSRLFYYCGMSVQTFFLYFVHDILHVTDNPQATVASLAILGQCAGAVMCYPVGVISDTCCHGRRKLFVYTACAVLSAATLAMVSATSLQDMVVLCAILGAANGVYLTMETSLAVDTLPSRMGNPSTTSQSNAPPDEDEDGGSAQLLGIWGVAAFLGSALGPMIGGPLLYTFGSVSTVGRPPVNDYKQQEDEGDMEEEVYGLAGYVVVLSLSSFYFLCSALALRYVRKPGE